MRKIFLTPLLLLAACAKPVQPNAVGAFEKVSADPVVHGERLAAVVGCTGCHGADLTGKDWSDELGVLWTANVTRAAARMNDSDLKRTILSGHQPGGRDLWDMPSYLFTKLNPDELDDIIAFVRTKPARGEVHPPPELGPVIKEKIAAGTYRSSVAEVARSGALDVPAAGPEHALARHIVRATCAECHGIDLTGKTDPFDGKTTPDIRLMAASYSLADFERLLTTGMASGGRSLGLMSDVARTRFAHLTGTERAAIYAYLRQQGEAAR